MFLTYSLTLSAELRTHWAKWLHGWKMPDIFVSIGVKGPVHLGFLMTHAQLSLHFHVHIPCMILCHKKVLMCVSRLSYTLVTEMTSAVVMFRCYSTKHWSVCLSLSLGSYFITMFYVLMIFYRITWWRGFHKCDTFDDEVVIYEYITNSAKNMAYINYIYSCGFVSAVVVPLYSVNCFT